MPDLSPVVQAFLAGCFTWALTALGAAGVFVIRGKGERMFNGMLGFAAGIMIAASFWSLILPAVAMSAGGSSPTWFPVAVGFLAGGVFLWALDRTLPHLHRFPKSKVEGVKTTWQRTTLLIVAMTLHNIPEGLAIGVAFGAVAAGLPAATLVAAVTLAIGVGIQNLPEGLAVSLPLRREGFSRLRSFWYGQLSAVVEPIAAVIGAATVIIARPILPYALAFAAGAMIFVVVEELIPASQTGDKTDLSTVGAMVGFTAMMILELAFS